MLNKVVLIHHSYFIKKTQHSIEQPDAAARHRIKDSYSFEIFFPAQPNKVNLVKVTDKLGNFTLNNSNCDTLQNLAASESFIIKKFIQLEYIFSVIY